MKKLFKKLGVGVLLAACVCTNVYGDTKDDEAYSEKRREAIQSRKGDYQSLCGKLIFPQEGGYEPKIIEKRYSDKVKKLIDDFSFQISNPEKIEKDGWTYFLKHKSDEAYMVKPGMLCRISEDRTRAEYLGEEMVKDIIAISGNWLYLEYRDELKKFNVVTRECIEIDSGKLRAWDIKDGYFYYIKEEYNEDGTYNNVTFLRVELGKDKPEILEEDVLKGETSALELRVRANPVVKRYLPFSRIPGTRRYAFDELDQRAKKKLGITQESLREEERILRDKVINYIGQDSENYYYQDGKLYFATQIFEPMILQREKANIYRESKASGEVKVIAKEVVYELPEYVFYKSNDEFIQDLDNLKDEKYLGEFKVKDMEECEAMFTKLIMDNKIEDKPFRVVFQVESCETSDDRLLNLKSKINETERNKQKEDGNLLLYVRIDKKYKDESSESLNCRIHGEFRWK